MKIQPFKVEEWMNAYETGAVYNIAETCVNSISLAELFSLAHISQDEFWQKIGKKRLTYGYIEGNPVLKSGISQLYKTIKPTEIVTAHGASGANHHLFYSLIEPGDEVISIVPTYQQLYSIPEAYHAQVRMLSLEASRQYSLDIDRLRQMVTPKTKVICINNPNNPTGALLSNVEMQQIAEIARTVDAYVLCDEVYRHLTQTDIWSESIADIYEKGISVSSMSKVFSLAGLRLGWIASHDTALLQSLASHRDYNLVSCGMLDEFIAAIALQHKDVLLERNRHIVQDNLHILDAWVQQEPYVWYVKPQAGTTALLHYIYDVPSYTLCRDMYKKTGVFAVPGDCFEVPQSMRIGYACDKNVLQQGLQYMSKFLSTLSV